MAKDLKLALKNRLDMIAPEYGLIELQYPSFARSCGYISQPLSACDAVEAVSALLEVAGGVKIEVEVEGARNGGEWFGGGKKTLDLVHSASSETLPHGIFSSPMRQAIALLRADDKLL